MHRWEGEMKRQAATLWSHYSFFVAKATEEMFRSGMEHMRGRGLRQGSTQKSG